MAGRMVRAPELTVDPASDAAALLRRVGFLCLMLGLPAAAFASRTGAVLVLAIAVPVVAIAALVGGGRRPLRANLEQLAGAPAFLAVAVAAGWAIASSIWAPPGAPSPVGSGALGTVGVAALGIAGFLTLPDRMRSANLYPMTIGAVLAAVIGIVVAQGWLGESATETARRTERGLAILVAYAWPAIAWLRSRGRDIEAIGLALLVAAASALAPTAAPVLSFLAGAVAYLVVQLAGRPGAIAVGVVVALAILAAPLAAWVAASGALPPLGGVTESIAAWRTPLLGEPGRLLTGHGAGAVRAVAATAGLPLVVGAPLLAAWFELGIVGMGAAAAAIPLALRRAGASFGPLLPGLAAAIVTCFSVALTGIDGGALWWPATLATVALLFLAAERGQFRTRRPRLAGLGFGRAVRP